MKFYIDNDYICHTNFEDGFREIEAEIEEIDLIENTYRFVPEGESWIRSDGISFEGEMFSKV